MKSLTVPARIDQLDTVQEFIQQELEAQACMPKVMIQISIAVEEIFVNIAHYAYQPVEGDATIRCEVGGDPLEVTIQLTASLTIPWKKRIRMSPCPQRKEALAALEFSW